MNTTTNNTIQPLNIDEDLKKKIESTEFVYLVAKSGIGKSFTGDYLQVVRNWNHVDGDFPLKESTFKPEYVDMVERLFISGKYAHIQELPEEERREWFAREGYHAYFTEVARKTLEAARESDKVVATHATYNADARNFFIDTLIASGAKEVRLVYLDCDFDVHMDALWKRALRQAEQFPGTMEEGLEFYGGSDFESFVKHQKHLIENYFEEPSESEKPTVVDVTAKDITTLDAVDRAFGVPDGEGRGDLSYEEMIEKIKAVDIIRDEGFFNNMEINLEEEAKMDEAEKKKRRSFRRNSSLRNSCCLKVPKANIEEAISA